MEQQSTTHTSIEAPVGTRPGFCTPGWEISKALTTPITAFVPKMVAQKIGIKRGINQFPLHPNWSQLGLGLDGPFWTSPLHAHLHHPLRGRHIVPKDMHLATVQLLDAAGIAGRCWMLLEGIPQSPGALACPAVGGRTSPVLSKIRGQREQGTRGGFFKLELGRLQNLWMCFKIKENTFRQSNRAEHGTATSPLLLISTSTI